MIRNWFESYDEAWNYFVTRETRPEDFWSALPEPDGSILAGWLTQGRDIVAACGQPAAG